MSAAIAPAPAPTIDATFVACNRVKGFLGTTSEMLEVLPPDPVAHVKGLSNEELFPLGEQALRDIVDDIIILDEIRSRFRAASGTPILGYQNWREFVERNSRYSIRTIQRRLSEKNGKDLSKVNHAPGNMYTRPPEPVTESGLPETVIALKDSNPEIFRRVQEGSLQVRTPKPKSRANYSEQDYFARIGRGLAAAFSDVDDRLTELANIKKSDWTPEAEKGIRCLILNLKEVSDKADDYTARLEAALREHA